MDIKLLRTFLVQGVGLVILVAFLLKLIFCILCKAKQGWQRGQVHSFDQSFPMDPAQADKEAVVVTVAVDIMDPKLARDCSQKLLDQPQQAPLKSKIPSSTKTAQAPNLHEPSATTASKAAAAAEGNHEQTPLDTFYKVYTGVSPGTRLL